MKSAILINGVSLPHHVIDAAIKWAVTSRSSLQAVFVYQSTSKHPYHGLPRDKAITRFMSGDLYAESNLINLIDRHIKYTISCCALYSIVCEVDVLKNPLLADIDGKVKGVEQIFADQNTFVRPKEFAYTTITSTNLVECYKEKLKWCTADVIGMKKNQVRKVI